MVNVITARINATKTRNPTTASAVISPIVKLLELLKRSGDGVVPLPRLSVPAGFAVLPEAFGFIELVVAETIEIPGDDLLLKITAVVIV